MGSELNRYMPATTMAGVDESSLIDAMQHLTEEERNRILEVMKRAHDIDEEATQRSREIKKDYQECNNKALAKQASFDKSHNLCPICAEWEFKETTLGAISNDRNVCSDCERIVCPNCGEFEFSAKTKFQVWICTVCSKRLKYMLSAGVQSIQQTGRLILPKQIQTDRGPEPLKKDDHYHSQQGANLDQYSDRYGNHQYDYRQGYEHLVHVDTPRADLQYQPVSRHPWQRSHSLCQYEDLSPRRQSDRRDSLPASMELSGNQPSFLDIPDDQYFSQSTLVHPESSSPGSSHRQTHRPPLQRTLSDTGNHRRSHEHSPHDTKDFSHHTELCHKAQVHREDSDSSDRSTESLHRQIVRPLSNERNSRRSKSPSDRGDNQSPHRPTDDYYMSEEEELALIAHQSRHDWQSHQSHDDMDGGDYSSHELDNSDHQPDIHTFQGSNRSYSQHHEWSPVMDLSPIEDVSPTLELEAEAEWLAEQSDHGSRLLESEKIPILPRHVHTVQEQASEELIDKGDSQSTTESGYESQSQGNNSTAVEKRDKPGRVSHLISAFENRSYDEEQEERLGELRAGGRQFMTSEESHSVDDVSQEDLCYGTDFDDEVPIIEEGVTFNIHGGRDMFAARHGSPARVKQSLQRKKSLEQQYTASSRPSELDVHRSNVIQTDVSSPSKVEEVSPASSTGSNRAQRPQTIPISTQPLSQPYSERKSPQPQARIRTSLSSSSMSSKSYSKPVPAPRRKADNSVRSKSLSTNPLESDDEIVEIRFDEASSPIITRHRASNVSNETSKRHHGATTPKVTTTSHNSPIDLRKSMDELRRKEENENLKTADLEKQLAEIRRLEERQRNILQHTLKQVVHSVQESQTLQTLQPEEQISTERIDCSSLLSPSFNRRTPLPSPALNNRQNASPQSPRKSSLRQDMQTIKENGAYTMAELASMSPASSHRTLSNMASPLLPPRLHEMRSASYSGGSQSLPTRNDRLMQQAYQEITQQSGALGDPFGDKNFRLSSSYTELLPKMESQRDNSGYFSDRETDRRKGDEMKVYTDEARKALLQWEIEKRQRQVEENKELRNELRKLIESGSIPSAQYERLRNLYRDHINRSREFLKLSNSSLSSIGSAVRGWDDRSIATDSDFYMSSNEHLAGPLSQSSTVERLMQSSDNLFTQKNLPKPSFAQSSPTPSRKKNSETLPSAAPNTLSLDSQQKDSANEAKVTLRGDPPAMPLLEIKSPKKSRPNSMESFRAGDMHRASSEMSFGDPEEKIVDAKLEGAGVTILKSKEKTAKLQTAMPVSRFDFPTKRILLIPGQTGRDRGVGLVIQGGRSIPGKAGSTGAFVSSIQPGTVAAQLLGELKPGDEIVEWNGVVLRNKANNIVQEIISKWNVEIELTVKLDKEPFPLPRHPTGTRDDHPNADKTSIGFESPQSDKSWSKEFDGSGNKKVLSPSHVSHDKQWHSDQSRRSRSSSNSQDENCSGFTKMEHNTARSAGLDEHTEELNRKLHDMSERLDTLVREPMSPDQNGKRFITEDKYHLKKEGSSTPDTKQRNGGDTLRKVERVGQPVLPHSEHSNDPGHNKGLESPMPRRGQVKSPQPVRSGSVPRRGAIGRIQNAPKLHHCGELEVMLMYDYVRHLLIVRVERAVQLAIAGRDSVNPFIKIHFLKGERIQEKRCTRYIESNPSPRWEQSFSFNVQEAELPGYRIKLSAWDYFQPKQNIFIGSTIIDLANHSHVDGNLRLYRLESDPIDKKSDSRNTTPRMPRAVRTTAEAVQQRRGRSADSRLSSKSSLDRADSREATPARKQSDSRSGTSISSSASPARISAELNNNNIKPGRQHMRQPPILTNRENR